MNPFEALRGLGTALLIIFAALVASMFLAGRASAQATGDLTIAWELPTTGCSVGLPTCDSVPLVGADALTGIEVYISDAPIPDDSSMAPTLILGPAVTTVEHTQTVTNGSTLYVRLRAVTATKKSLFSEQAFKLIKLDVTPNVPTNVTIHIQIL